MELRQQQSLHRANPTGGAVNKQQVIVTKVVSQVGLPQAIFDRRTGVHTQRVFLQEPGLGGAPPLFSVAVVATALPQQQQLQRASRCGSSGQAVKLLQHHHQHQSRRRHQGVL